MPSIFVSHSHLDDQFGLRLIADLKAKFGDNEVWYDSSGGLHTGDEWIKQIMAEIDARSVFLVILSPNAMASNWVPREMDVAYYLHATAGKHLVPVTYAPCAIPANWRVIQGTDFTDPAQYNVKIQSLLGDIARLTNIPQPSIPSTSNSVPSIVVDQLHRGDFLTITDAVAAARPGTQIRIRPGLYQEGILLDKPLELIGEGERDDIVITVRGTNVIRFATTAGRVANLTLRQAGQEGDRFFAVYCAQGRLALEDCDISSQSSSCIGIHNGADPRVRRNRIHDGKENGIFIYEQGQGLIENNEIFANTTPSIGIQEGSNPIIRHNRIYNGKDGGIFILEQGQGLIEDNEIFAHTTAGIAIKTGGNPTIRRNRIHDGKDTGIHIYDQGQGIIEDNEIFAHMYCGITTKMDGNPTVRRNTITHNGEYAIWIHDKGSGTYEDNDLRGNTKGSWLISDNSLPLVKRARNQE